MNIQEWKNILTQIKSENDPERLGELAETLNALAQDGGILGYIALHDAADAAQKFLKKDTVVAAREAGLKVNARSKELTIVESIREQLYDE